MLKIGKNWDKIANYPPQCSTKSAPLYTGIFLASITPQLNYLSNLFTTWIDLLVQFSAHNKFTSQYYCSLL